MRKYCATVFQMMELPKHQNHGWQNTWGTPLRFMAIITECPWTQWKLQKISELMYLIDHCKMNKVRGLNLNEVDTVISRGKIVKSSEKYNYVDQLPELFDRGNMDSCSKYVDDEANRSALTCEFSSKVAKGDPLARIKRKEGKRFYWPPYQYAKVIEIFQTFIARR